MLTDIFADRYLGVELWSDFGEPERRLLVQSFRILSEQICPWFVDGKVSDRGKDFWEDIHSRLSMELGLKSLSPLAYSYQTTWNGKPVTQSGVYSMMSVCETWVTAAFNDSISADRFVKERLSLVEIGMRKREEEIAALNATLSERVAQEVRRSKTRTGMRVPGEPGSGTIAWNKTINAEFEGNVSELNTRFRRAGCNLNYHNGFIQISSDTLTEQQIETPFWTLVADPKWKNVDEDMKNALDLRDAGNGDPAFYAARALESTIKIVSEDIGATTGKEISAANFIERLASKNVKFLAPWESAALKSFFTEIRNLLGHGAGSSEMPNLSDEQTDWAIENAMSWIKSLINRMET